MKRLYTYILSLLLIGCSKRDLDIQLEKSIIEYQKKVPIPKSKKVNRNLKEYKFLYVIDINLNGNDTIINIVRYPSGIPKDTNYFGVYEINKFTPVVIYDDEKLGDFFIKNRVRNTLLKKYELNKNERHFVDYPPVYSYIVKKHKINLIGIDTISNNWIK